jgi:hypothetical protein
LGRVGCVLDTIGKPPMSKWVYGDNFIIFKSKAKEILNIVFFSIGNSIMIKVLI